MTGVMVVVCAAFGLAVLEAKNESMFLRTKEMPESTAPFNVEAAGQGVQSNKRVRISRGELQPQRRPVH